jgi:hypothetical protein
VINNRVLFTGMAAVVVFATCFAVQGCDLQKMIKVDVPAGVLLTGWFLKRPGEDKVVAKEKEDSYNAGLAKGKEMVEIIKGAINGES